MTIKELYEWAEKEGCLDAELLYREPLSKRNVPIEEPFACVYRGKDKELLAVEFWSAYKNAGIGEVEE